MIATSLRKRLEGKARELKAETHALYLAARHPQTPWYAKMFAAMIVAYALSPIDLVPDFIPVIGFLDDLVVIPLGIILARRMIPAAVLTECRARAAQSVGAQPASRIAMLVVLLIWLGLATLLMVWAYDAFSW